MSRRWRRSALGRKLRTLPRSVRFDTRATAMGRSSWSRCRHTAAGIPMSLSRTRKDVRRPVWHDVFVLILSGNPLVGDLRRVQLGGSLFVSGPPSCRDNGSCGCLADIGAALNPACQPSQGLDRKTVGIPDLGRLGFDRCSRRYRHAGIGRPQIPRVARRRFW